VLRIEVRLLRIDDDYGGKRAYQLPYIITKKTDIAVLERLLCSRTDALLIRAKL
jgi:hypothetical protein